MNRIKCPYCAESETKVLDSRENEDSTRRRRECLGCEKRFTTYERVENLALNVVKKDGSIQPFDADKIKKGILKAVEKRGIGEDKINEIADEIESKLKSVDSTDISSKRIGEEVMKRLKKLDKVAYVRFASVYRDFRDVEDFQKEVEGLLKK